MKAILGRDIQVGDTITDGRLQGVVLQCLGEDSGGRRFKLDIGHLSFLSRTVVGLVHRPWPEGKTEKEMLAEVRRFASDVVVGGATRRLFRALEEYKLGKEDPCEIGTCDHGKNTVGTCMVYALENSLRRAR